MDSESTDSSLESPSKTVPYNELIDKARFEKFCSDTRKLSLTSTDVTNLKEQLNISEHDPTGGDFVEQEVRLYSDDRDTDKFNHVSKD